MLSLVSTTDCSNTERARRHQRMRAAPLALVCLLAFVAAILPWRGGGAPSGCEVVHESNGWAIERCPADQGGDPSMEVVVDGAARGGAALVRIYHKSQHWPGTPQVAIISASGYVRLKQNADPVPPIPFGGSFVLGPAYWSGAATYHHNPRLHRLEIDTARLPSAPLRMRASATNQDFAIAYAMVLPPPQDHLTRLHITQTYTATADVAIDQEQTAKHEGFKLVQFSSMFINQGGACDGATNCHDSDSARYIGADLARHQRAFSSLTLLGFVFSAPQPLGSTWLDALHSDDQGWQGNTPNLRIALDDLPIDRTITPQGWIGKTSSPNDDNVGLWLHDDGTASRFWQAGQHGQIGYWLLAQDNPPEPWAELGLRAGQVFLDFEGNYNCFPVLPADRPVSAIVAPIAGYADTALQLSYNLDAGNNNWAQIRCNFDPPLDLSAYDHLRLDWRGDPAAANSLQVGLINPGAEKEQIFARGYHHATQRAWWGQLVIPFAFLQPWAADTSFDPGKVSALFVSVAKDPADDVGGAGRIAIDNLSTENVGARIVPSGFEAASLNPSAAAAARWLAAQQQPNGLLKSWSEEPVCLAHMYDQALGLLVFVDQAMWTEADALVSALVAAQNADGSWFKARNCLTLVPETDNRWEGDIAWVSYALSRYLALGGTHAQATAARDRAAAWLASRINQADGCLVIDHTEGTIDAWWALQAAGPVYGDATDGLKHCLLTYYWDDQIGRFKGGKDWWQPYLDNQTWGAAFLKAIGEELKARRALSYASAVLRLPAQGGQLAGFDGQAGPWAMWNEGVAQFVAVGGPGSSDLILELLAQQRADGAMPGAPDTFAGAGVWTTRWHGIAPTAWLYSALCGGLLHPGMGSGCYRVFMPIVVRGSSGNADGIIEAGVGTAAVIPTSPNLEITLEVRPLSASPEISLQLAPLLRPSPVVTHTQRSSVVLPGGGGNAVGQHAAAGCDRSPANPARSQTQDLDQEIVDWGVYCEGAPTWVLENAAAPSLDGTSLRCSITGGAAYSNVHCYRNLPPEPNATEFVLSLSFWLNQDTSCNNQGTPSVVQALEFTMNKWRQSKRYEFALQWLNVGAGAPQWRYWDPHRPEPDRWVPLNPPAPHCLQGRQWHTLTLEGRIVMEQVQYRRFLIDGQPYTLDMRLPPADTPGEADRLAVAVQLDGNAAMNAYDLFVDQVSFTRKSAGRAYLPLVIQAN